MNRRRSILTVFWLAVFTNLAGAADGVFVRFQLVEPTETTWFVTLGGYIHNDPWLLPEATWPDGAGREVSKRVVSGQFSPWFDLGAHAGQRLHGRLNRAGGVAEFPNVTAEFVCGVTNPTRHAVIELANAPEGTAVVKRFEEFFAGGKTSFLVSPALRADADSLETASQMTARRLAWAREASGGRRASPTNLWVQTPTDRIPAPKSDPARLARIRVAKMPAITQPVLFHTPEADAVLSALEVFPADHAFNQVVEDWPLHPNSSAIVASIGLEKPFRYNTDMGFVLVPPNQPRVEVKIVDYPGESDAGPFPVPDNVPIEGWPGWHQRGNTRPPSLEEVQRRPEKYIGDRHAIVVDPVNRMLYEFFTFGKTPEGWAAGQASVFDLKTNVLRPAGWTSADAAGLPIFPAVVRYDELQRGLVEHAMRVTVTRTRRAYIAPATHFASRLEDPNLPRMGERLRLRADFDIRGFSTPTQAILKGLKKYGMLVADNGIDWAISVTPDPRIPVLHEELRRIKGVNFEVVVTPQ